MTQQPTRWSMVEPIGRVPFQVRMNPKLKDDIYDMARIEGKHIYEITENAFRHYLKDEWFSPRINSSMGNSYKGSDLPLFSIFHL